MKCKGTEIILLDLDCIFYFHWIQLNLKSKYWYEK